MEYIFKKMDFFMGIHKKTTASILIFHRMPVKIFYVRKIALY